MIIAYLILCHADPEHVRRLVKKLTDGNEDHAFVHVDNKSNIEEFYTLYSIDRVHVIEERIDVWWGGFSSVIATMKLITCALKLCSANRFVLLQGADYPLKSVSDIRSFFGDKHSIEFIRACNCTKSTSKYIYAKARYFQLLDSPSIYKKIINRVVRYSGVRLKRDQAPLGNMFVDIFWGCAQWALTRECVSYIVSFMDDARFNNYFKSSFPSDEIYFHTIVHNSKFSTSSANNGYQPDVSNLVMLRNLHYFEYPRLVKVFTSNDFDFLQQRPELFIRKVTTMNSSTLLDMLDIEHHRTL